MAKSNKLSISLSELYKQVFGKLAKRQLIVLASALGVLVLLVGATMLFAKPKQQTIASQTGGNAPAEQTQTPQQPAPAAEAKPSEEKPAEPEKKAPISTPSANSTPAPQNQVAPTRDQIKFSNIFDVINVRLDFVNIKCEQRQYPAQSHITVYGNASLNAPSPGGSITYRWEIMGSTTELHGTIPDFGAVKSVNVPANNSMASLGNMTAYGPVYEPFSARVHVLSPRDIASNWVRVPASTETCR